VPTLNELLGQIAELNPDPNEFANGLQSTFQPGFHAVFERGHKTKGSDAKKQIDALNKTIEEKDAEIVTLTAKAEEAGKGNADIAKVRADFQKEIADLKEKHKTDRLKDAEKFNASVINRAVTDLQRMYEGMGMFEVHAKANAEAMRSRVRPKEDGSFEILKDAGSEVAIQPADGKSETALRTLADESRKGFPKEMFTSGVKRGAGGKTEDTTTSGGGSMPDRIRRREAAKKEAREEGRPAPGATPLFERMGVPKPA
jgi:hypothetical protein